MSSDSGSNDENNIKTLTPYNPNNILIQIGDIINILKCNGIDKINEKNINIDVYRQAFMHKSYTFKSNYELSRKDDENIIISERPENCMDLSEGDSYEKLEFLGDCVVELVVVKHLFDRYNDLNGSDEGFLTKLKTRLVSTKSLASFSEYLGFNKFMIVSKHVEEKCEGRVNPRILEDIFEAFIAALFLDFTEIETDTQQRYDLMSGPGYEICEKFITTIIENTVDFENLIMNDDNYKDILLRYFQNTYKITPKYIEIEAEGPPHNRTFVMGVLDNQGSIIGKGTKKSKKAAEQEASRQALIYLDQLCE